MCRDSAKLLDCKLSLRYEKEMNTSIGDGRSHTRNLGHSYVNLCPPGYASHQVDYLKYNFLWPASR